MTFPGGLVVKNPPAQVRHSGDMGSIPGQEDPLEEGMAYSPWGHKESDMTERLHFTH